jgi:hypothetical protein
VPFEYRLVTTVEELNKLSDEGYELLQIVPAGQDGKAGDRIYMRREKRRGQTPGFSAQSNTR